MNYEFTIIHVPSRFYQDVKEIKDGQILKALL